MALKERRRRGSSQAWLQRRSAAATTTSHGRSPSARFPLTGGANFCQQVSDRNKWHVWHMDVTLERFGPGWQRLNGCRYHQMPLETARKNRTIYCAFLKMTTTVLNQAAAFSTCSHFYCMLTHLHGTGKHNSHSEKPQDNDGSVFRPAR